MKIIELKSENIKRLTAVQITPDGNLVQITGKNGQGKTSVLDSIWWALGGTDDIQAQPIRKGADSGRIELKLGEKGEVGLIVERRFTAKGSYLSVSNADGFKATTPQKMLNEILGALAFDPLAFMRMDGKKQFETLRRLVPLAIDVDALDKQRAELFEQRRDVNRRLGDLKAQASGVVIGDDWPEAEIDTAPILSDLAGVDEHNKTVREAIRATEEVERNARNLEARITETEADVDRAIEQAAVQVEAAENALFKAREMFKRIDEDGAKAIEQAKADAAAARRQADELAAQPVAELLDPAALSEKLLTAQADNLKVKKRQERAVLDERVTKGAAIADDLTAKIEGIDKTKRDAIAAAPMPVSGLSLGDGVVLFKDLPLDQASNAEQLMVSTAIAVALNPKLRVICIRDGSLLDEDAMKALATFSDERDMQVWIERVDGSGAVGIVMEDGHVRGQEPPADTHAAEKIASEERQQELLDNSQFGAGA